MQKLTIITGQPEDIFSNYLQGKGVKITRLKSHETDQLNDDKNLKILIVNLNQKESFSIKEKFPLARVLTINGGREQFHALITILHTDHNHEYYVFDSWERFEEIIFSKFSRPAARMEYVSSGRNKEGTPCDSYRINTKVTKKKSALKKNGKELDMFIEAMIVLSELYFAWMEEWIKGISYMSFPVDPSYLPKNNKKKAVRIIKVPIKENEHLGLPIFKAEDWVVFVDEHDLELCRGAVNQIDGKYILVKLSETFLFKHLKEIKSYRPSPDFLEKKLGILKKHLEDFNFKRSEKVWIRNYKNITSNETPISFLGDCSQKIDGSEAISFHGTNYLLTKRTQNILRDESQLTSYINSTGPDFFRLISGPAATGKTFFGGCIIEKFFQEGQITVVVSHSNLGVDTVLCETAKQINAKYVFRIGNNPDVMTQDARNFHKFSRHKNKFFGKDEKEMGATQAEYEFIESLLKKGKGIVLGCTIDSYYLVDITLNKMKKKPKVIVIDEASKGYFFEFLPVISAAEERVIMIGDDQQLGNIAVPKELTKFLEDSVENNKLPMSHAINKLNLPKPLTYYFSYGFFNSLIELGYFDVDLLKINRRSLKNISDMASNVFYEGQIVCGLFNPNKGKSGLIVFYDTKEVEKAIDQKIGTSSYNAIEAAFLVKKFIHRAVNVVKNGGSIKDLVIITPYSAQVGWLKRKLRKHLLYTKGLNEQVNAENIDEILNDLVITVDGIQGGERKIVFISLVRSNDENDIGFNNDHRRIRVTCTRAKEEMIFIGNSETFINCKFPEIREIFSKMILSIQKIGKYEVLKN